MASLVTTQERERILRSHHVMKIMYFQCNNNEHIASKGMKAIISFCVELKIMYFNEKKLLYNEKKSH